MPAGFLYDLAAPSFTSAEAVTPSMPIGNLSDPQPRRRARLTGVAVSIVADFGAARSVDCFGLISTTLSTGATIRARLGTVLNTWTTDTGTLAAEAQDAAQGNVILTLGAPVTARFLRLDIADAPAFTDIGLLVAGALWRAQRGMAYGVREGRMILDRRDRNPFTGAEFPVPAIANPRMAAFTLPSLSTSEARNRHLDLVRLLGAAKDGLVIMELNDTLAERNRRAIWGAINVPGEDAAVSRDSFPLSSRAFRVVERL
jgi:hypothetical protein